MTNIAVILAGGTGSRMGGGIPKQLLPLGDGRCILEHSVDAFEAAPCIQQIGIVMHSDYMVQAQQLLLRNTWQKVAWIIPGGHERYESSLNAIRHIQETIVGKSDVSNVGLMSCTDLAWTSNTDLAETNILLHDAARPFVSQQIIQDVCTALTQYKAVTVAIPATDTIYQVTPSQTIAEIPQRQSIMYAQTPQAFRLTTISEAYHKALQDSTQQDSKLSATDDCGIVHEYLPTTNIHIVPGAPSNRKITYPEDLKNE